MYVHYSIISYQGCDEMENNEVEVDSYPHCLLAHDLTHQLTPALLHDQLEHRLQCLSGGSHVMYNLTTANVSERPYIYHV